MSAAIKPTTTKAAMIVTDVKPPRASLIARATRAPKINSKLVRQAVPEVVLARALRCVDLDLDTT